MKSFDRTEKNRIREKVISHFGNKTKVALFLPSNECLDLKLALEKGIINRQTFIIAAEENEDKFRPIICFLNENFDNFYFHRDKLTTMDVHAIVEKLGKKIDCAFQDYCGEYNSDIHFWNDYLLSCCERGAKLAYTFRSVSRNNNLIKDIVDNNALDEYIGNARQNGSKTASWMLRNQGNVKVNSEEEYRDSSDMITIFGTALGKESVEDELELYFNPSWLGKGKEKEKVMTGVNAIVERFKSAGKSIPKLAGAKRMATCYVQNQVKKNRKPERLYHAAVKARLTAAGVKTNW